MQHELGKSHEFPIVGFALVFRLAAATLLMYTSSSAVVVRRSRANQSEATDTLTFVEYHCTKP
jgi:hypothetical protein